MFSSPKLYLKNVIKGVVKQPKVSVTVTVSHCSLVFYTVSVCFTLFLCVLHCRFLVFYTLFNLFGIEFVANRTLWVALNLSRITHF